MLLSRKVVSYPSSTLRYVFCLCVMFALAQFPTLVPSAPSQQDIEGQEGRVTGGLDIFHLHIHLLATYSGFVCWMYCDLYFYYFLSPSISFIMVGLRSVQSHCAKPPWFFTVNNSVGSPRLLFDVWMRPTLWHIVRKACQSFSRQ